jgi:hypothetical protein
MAQQWFYDKQIRRFLLQFARIFSNFQVEFGRDEQGNPTLIRVPVRYGDSSRQAQTVLQNNSASSLPSTPLMTFYITGMDYDRPRMQDPYFVSKTQVRQRRYDVDTDTYETVQGNAFTIERLMPVPYVLTVNLDMWTSNTNQKFQLIEQIATLFNPSLEIQNTDSYLDWTSLSVVELERTTWSSRTIPVGTEDPIDIYTMTFKLPIWISSPAKVKKLGVVEKIIASVYDSNADAFDAIQNEDLLLGTRQLITPYGYQVLLLNNRLQLLKESAVVNAPNASEAVPSNPASNLLWPSVLGMYGNFRPGISQIRLDIQWDDDDNVIVGTVVVDPTDARFLLYTPDSGTVPQNTLAPVDAIIDPLQSGPGSGLAVAQTGQRYLLLDSIGDYDNPDPASAWGVLAANANDIVEYNGTAWQVSFDSEGATNSQYVTNINTDVQYRWIGTQWVKSYDGLYPGGEWSLVL